VNEQLNIAIMNPQTLKIKTVKFSEHPIVDMAQSEPLKFDISSIGLNCHSSFVQDGTFLTDFYCLAVLNKVTDLYKSELLDFLEHQCIKVKKANDWLDNLETLIELNAEFFDTDCKISKLLKLDISIQVFRSNIKYNRKPIKPQLINWDNISPLETISKFDYNAVKFDLLKLTTYQTKKAYLIELKADFLQSESICSVSANKSFGTFIDIELEKLENLHQIPSESKVVQLDPIRPRQKLRINGNTNIFIDIFYRLLNEYKPEGKPFIDATSTDIANLIVENFTNREGKNLSINTVQTILSPNRVEKRPSCDKRFCMRNFNQQ
jgi:hypothetical protein